MRGSQPIFVFWQQCSQCNYETAAHGRVKCPECECNMTSIAMAGSVVDDRKRGEE
jgi:hypothetical protein